MIQVSEAHRRHLEIQTRIVTELIEAHYASEHRIAENHPECMRCVRTAQQLAAADRLANAIFPVTA